MIEYGVWYEAPNDKCWYYNNSTKEIITWTDINQVHQFVAMKRAEFPSFTYETREVNLRLLCEECGANVGSCECNVCVECGMSYCEDCEEYACSCSCLV